MPTIDGCKLRELRIRKGWSLETLAVRSGVSERAIRDLETGATEHPRPTTVLWLAKALEVDPQQLWKDAPVALDQRRPQAAVVVRDLQGAVMYRRDVYSRWIMVGRDADLNQIVLAHQQVSLVHARIEIRRSDLEVRDCGTSNGIFVDGTRVESSRSVAFGAAITVHPFVIEIHRTGDDRLVPAKTLRMSR